MKINLKAITEEGETYHFDRRTGEFAGVLDDIIGRRAFAVDVEIRPLGNGYEMRGSLQASYADNCSHCGYDIEVPMTGVINEILIIEEARPRDAQSVRGQNSVKFDGQNPSVTYLNSEEFVLTEFIHEMMASSLEAYPKCSDRQKCATQAHRVHEVMESGKGHPAFQILQVMKLKH